MSQASTLSYNAVTLDDIKAALARIATGIVRTPCLRSAALSALCEAEVYLKLETFQRSGSFKDRGALNRLLQLTDEERARGVVAVSAGNHAQALAYHSSRLGIEATIVMPTTAPYAKVLRTKAFGGKVVQCGETLDDGMIMMREIQEEKGALFVSPYDDAQVVAGQGTIGLEIAQDVESPDAVVVPIGGGGIITGIATALKTEGGKGGKTEVIGVEAAMYPSMYNLVRGKQAEVGGQTLAEGIAVKQPGAANAEAVKKWVADILLLSEPALELGVVTLLEQGRVLAEGAGAAPLAAMLAYPERFKGKKVVLLVCGANIDTRLLASVLTRTMARRSSLVHIDVSISDQPGILAQVASIFGEGGANIVEVSHRRMFEACAAKEAELDIVAETRNEEHIQELLSKLRAQGFRASRRRGFD